MSKNEKIKEQIGWLKVIFGLLFATDISLIAFLFNRVDTLESTKVLFVLFGLVLVTLSILYINKKAMNKIDSLEDL